MEKKEKEEKEKEKEVEEDGEEECEGECESSESGEGESLDEEDNVSSSDFDPEMVCVCVCVLCVSFYVCVEILMLQSHDSCHIEMCSRACRAGCRKPVVIGLVEPARLSRGRVVCLCIERP